MPEIFYKFYVKRFNLEGIKPNIIHNKLTELSEKKDVKIITQNIDGLHQLAGFDSNNIVELHGTLKECVCDYCKEKYPENYIRNIIEENKDKHFEEYSVKYICPKCGLGRIRPNITLYDEQLDRFELNKSRLFIHSANLIICAGTSFNVFPANSLIGSYRRKI